MGSPLSPTVANIFMEHFEENAIGSFSYKFKQWRWYVDDTNFIWPHGKDKLNDFLIHMNNQSKHIKFTMEIEVDSKLPFIDVFITRNDDGSLAHQVQRKKTHTHKYIHVDSHHHLAQNIGILNTLATRAKHISYPTHLD